MLRVYGTLSWLVVTWKRADSVEAHTGGETPGSEMLAKSWKKAELEHVQSMFAIFTLSEMKVPLLLINKGGGGEHMEYPC